jgi:hypothetical protein
VAPPNRFVDAGKTELNKTLVLCKRETTSPKIRKNPEVARQGDYKAAKSIPAAGGVSWVRVLHGVTFVSERYDCEIWMNGPTELAKYG